jgi:hypothetical protein
VLDETKRPHIGDDGTPAFGYDRSAIVNSMRAFPVAS